MEKEIIEETIVEQPVVETPAVETPAVEPSAPKASKPKTSKPKKEDGVEVEGVEVEVVGEAVHSNNGSQQYRVSVKIPRRVNYSLYLREAILMNLHKTDLLYTGVVTWNIDKLDISPVEVTFIGKNVFDLSRDECFAVKAYYGLGGFQCFDGDLRTVQKEVYRRFAQFFGINNGASEEYLKWKPIILKRMACPQGDTVIPQELPVAFDDLGDCFRKTFRK